MKKFLTIIGTCATLMLSQTASAESLYERIKDDIAHEIAAEEIDAELADYIAAIHKEKWDLEAEDIHTILRGNGSVVCGDKAIDEPGKTLMECQIMVGDVTRLAGYEKNVRSLGRSLQSIATGYELPISDLPGRSMKLSTDLRGVVNMWSAGTGSIKSTITGALIRNVAVDPETFEPLIQTVAEELDSLSPEERTAAVWRYQYGARLVRGTRNPRFPPQPDDGQSNPGTERQYMFKQWDDLEETLRGIWDEISDDTFDPPLSKNETVYYVFPQDMLKGNLPDNIIVWARIDGDAANGQPFGDVGLQWETPLEPVLPSLMTEDDDPILGGNYPPEPVGTNGSEDPQPVDGHGLCTSPSALRGYLCRTFVLEAPEERCPDPGDLNKDAINLVHCQQGREDPLEDSGVWCCNEEKNRCSQATNSLKCVQGGGSPSATMEGCAANGCPVPAVNPVLCCLKNNGGMCVETVNSVECITRGGAPSADAAACVANGCAAPKPELQRYTAAGADVCRDINWKTPQGFDPQTQCKVQLGCSPSCALGTGKSAETTAKTTDGIIQICAAANSPDIQDTYLIFHEMVHAYQLCSYPPGTIYKKPANNASENERREMKQWNSALCCRMEREAYRAQCDMMALDGVFDGMTPIDDIPLNAETCAELWTDFSCGPRDGYDGCYTSYEYTPAFKNAMLLASGKNPKNLPDTCAAAIDPTTMDSRMKAMKESIERRDDICRPGEETTYTNRIGNNLCYIGQCVEQSTERHRLTPGRTAAGVSDEVAPWDDRMTGAPYGNLIMNPPISQGILPAYRPHLLIREAEIALCQLQGLPPQTPPVLCLADPNRQLEQPAESGISIAYNLVQQTYEQNLSTADMLTLIPYLGSREATDLYGDYMREASRSFAGILDIAAQMLDEVKDMEFPTEMCPVGDGFPTPPSS